MYLQLGEWKISVEMIGNSRHLFEKYQAIFDKISKLVESFWTYIND